MVKSSGLVAVLLGSLICFLILGYGCNGTTPTFVSGVVTGLAVKVNQANEVTEELNTNIDAAIKANKELMVLSNSADPIKVIGAIDPNLAEKIIVLVSNLKELEIKAKEFEDKKGKTDWQTIITTLLLGIFSGGTGVNLYKNRNVS